MPDGKGGWHFPPRPPATGKNTIVLFYGYVNPPWNRHGQDAMIEFAQDSLTRNGCTGRLRVAREGLNGTLMGSYSSIRKFTAELTEWHAANPSGHRVHGQSEDNPWSFKYVDNQPDSVLEKELKVFPVSELVTYGFPRNAAASISAGGKHLSPAEYHKAMEDPNAVMIDVRNFNESIIGKFGECAARSGFLRSHTLSLTERRIRCAIVSHMNFSCVHMCQSVQHRQRSKCSIRKCGDQLSFLSGLSRTPTSSRARRC